MNSLLVSESRPKKKRKVVNSDTESDGGGEVGEFGLISKS